MKDKLFWIALAIAGVILFNKFNGQRANEYEVEEAQDHPAQYPGENRQTTSTTGREKTISTGTYGDLKLPRKNGSSTSKANDRQREINADLTRDRRNTEKQIDAGDYGTLTLPSKNSSTNRSLTGVEDNSNSYQESDSRGGATSRPQSTSAGKSSSSSSSTLIKLDRETKAGSASIKDRANESRLVLKDELLQLNDCRKFNIYIDTDGYCNANSVSGCSIYVKAGGELILSSGSTNNSVIYEDGAIVRTTSESRGNNNFYAYASVQFQ